MGRIRRSRCKTQAAPDHDRTGDIERRFNSVCDESVSIPENAADNFDDGEGNVDDQTNQREPRAGLQTGRDRLRMRRRIHRMNKTINAIEGKYPGRREVPAVPGFEGAGVVVEVGAEVSTIAKGALVILPHDIGTW